MSSPAHTISSDDEETKRVAEMKARHDAEMREASERKAQKDQERRERRECEKHEKKEREEKEAREVGDALALVDRERIEHDRRCLTEEAKEVAVVAVAREMAEPEGTQNEREREELRRVSMSGGVPGGELGSGQGSSDLESEEGEEGDPEDGSQRSFHGPEVPTRCNTAEVVIVRPARRVPDEEAREESGEVSSSFRRGSMLTST